MGIHERKEREKEQRREEILNAAQAVFFEKGLTNSTMDEIAEKAELSKGTLYLYYSSKEDLYLAVMTRGFDLLHQMCVEAVERSASPVEAIWNLSKAYFEFFEKQRNYFHMFYFLQSPALHKQVSPDMMESCTQQTNKTWELFINLFQQGVDEGMFRKDISPPEAAVILWSSANSILIRIDNECERWKEQLNVDLVQVYFRSNALFLESVMTKKGTTSFAPLLNDIPAATA